MSIITYETQNKPPNWAIDVRLDGKKVGEIRSYATGWGYVPKGNRGTDKIYPSIPTVKAALEDL